MSNMKKLRVAGKAVLLVLLLCMPWVVLSPATNPPAEWAELMHITAMALLSMLAWMSFASLWARIGAVVFVFAYSGLMELLQHFSPVRTGDWQDVRVNATGVLIGVALVVLRMAARRGK